MATLLKIEDFFRIEAERMESLRRPNGSMPVSELYRMKGLLPPKWRQVRGKRRHTAAIIRTLMRRALPFQKPDLIAIMQWCIGYEGRYFPMAPLKHIIQALKRYLSKMPLDLELLNAMKQFGLRLQSSYREDVKQLGAQVEQLCGMASSKLPDS